MRALGGCVLLQALSEQRGRGIKGGGQKAQQFPVAWSSNTLVSTAVSVRSDGRWTTHNRTLMAKFAGFSVHGGPPLAHISAQLSPSGQPYYAGIMHHIER